MHEETISLKITVLAQYLRNINIFLYILYFIIVKNCSAKSKCNIIGPTYNFPCAELVNFAVLAFLIGSLR